jgi:hypothetical protein
MSSYRWIGWIIDDFGNPFRVWRTPNGWFRFDHAAHPMRLSGMSSEFRRKLRGETPGFRPRGLRSP